MNWWDESGTQPKHHSGNPQSKPVAANWAALAPVLLLVLCMCAGCAIVALVVLR